MENSGNSDTRVSEKNVNCLHFTVVYMSDVYCELAQTLASAELANLIDRFTVHAGISPRNRYATQIQALRKYSAVNNNYLFFYRLLFFSVEP